MKKYLVIAVVLAALAATGLVPQNAAGQSSSQSVPTNETNQDLLDNIDTTQEKTTDSLKQDYREWNQTFVLTRLKRQLLDRITNQVVRYIQGGGTPKFVTNWKDYLKNSADAAAGEFINALAGANLCAPFANTLRGVFSLGGAASGRFRQRVQCTLSDAVRNTEEFYNDFTKGGWAGYNALWEPQNNIYGTYLIALDEMVSRVSAETEAAKNEAIAGGGFLGARDASGNIQTPGSVIAHMAEKIVDTDFDFINDADQLRNFAGVLGDALMSRLLTEADGLLSSRLNDRGDNYNEFVNGRDVVRGTTEQATFRDQQKRLVRDIDESVTLRRSVQSSLDALLATAQQTDPAVTLATVLEQSRQSLVQNRDYLTDLQNKWSALTDANIKKGSCPGKIQTPTKISKNIVPPMQGDIDDIISGIDAIDLVRGETIEIPETYASAIAALSSCAGEVTAAGNATVSNLCMLDLLGFYRGVITAAENNEPGRGVLEELQSTLGGDIVRTARATKRGIQRLNAVEQKTTEIICEDGKNLSFLPDKDSGHPEDKETYQSLYNACTKDPVPGDVSNPAFCAP